MATLPTKNPLADLSASYYSYWTDGTTEGFSTLSVLLGSTAAAAATATFAAMEGTPIGATTPDTGSFTTLTATTSNLGTVSSGTWQGAAIANAYVAGIDQNLLTTSSPTFAGLTVASDLTLAAGSITSASGAISFGNENLSTSGVWTIGSTAVNSGEALSATVAGHNLSGTYDVLAKFSSTDAGGYGIRIGQEGSDGVISGIGTSGLQFWTYNGSSWGARYSISSAGNHDFQSGNLTTTGNFVVGGSAGNLSTLGDSYLTLGTTGTDDRAFLEIAGHFTSDTVVGAISFHNLAHGNDRLAQITGYRSGANDSMALRFNTATSGVLGLAYEIDPSGNHDFQAGSITTTGTLSSGAATVTGDLTLSAASPTMYWSGTGGDYGTIAWAEGDPDSWLFSYHQNSGLISQFGFTSTSEAAGDGWWYVAPGGTERLRVTASGASITGTLEVSSSFRASNGTVTSPSIAFTSDTNTGFYRVGENNIAVSTGGSQVQSWTTTGATVTGTLGVSGDATFDSQINLGATAGAHLQYEVVTGIPIFRADSDARLVRIAGGTGAGDGNGAWISLQGEDFGGVNAGGDLTLSASSVGSVVLRAGSSTALTLDSSQNATFAGRTISAIDGTAGAPSFRREGQGSGMYFSGSSTLFSSGSILALTLAGANATFAGNVTINGETAIKQLLISDYGSAATDIVGLVGGSQFGNIIQSKASGHLVLGLRDNDTADAVAILSGGGNYTADTTYDTAVALFKADGNTILGGDLTLSAGDLTVRQQSGNTEISIDSVDASGQSILKFYDNNTALWGFLTNKGPGSFRFYDYSRGTDVFNIDSSGNFLLGSTSTSANAQFYSTKAFSNASGAVYGSHFSYSQSVATTGDLRGQHITTTASHATGSIASLIGQYTLVNSTGGGDIAAIYAHRIVVNSGAAGSNSQVYGLRVDMDNANAGANWSNAYGLYIDGFTATGTITNRWGIYQAGGGENNYLAGDLRIGTTSAFGSEILTVEGFSSDDYVARIINTDNTGAAQGLYVGVNSASSSVHLLTLAVDVDGTPDTIFDVGNSYTYNELALRVGTASATSHGEEVLRAQVSSASALIAANFHNNSTGGVYAQFTNSDTGTTSGKGFIVGLNASEHATVWNLDAGILKFGTNNTERFRVAADAYAIGIGTTDVESWANTFGVVEFGGSALFGRTTATDGFTSGLVHNAYYDGAWKYKSTDESSQYLLGGNGTHRWSTAASGTADNALTWSEKMRLTNAGMLLVGDTANANMTVGLTINQGANDDEIISLKSSDISHALVSVTETDTFFNVKKRTGGGGGVAMNVVGESTIGAIPFRLNVWGGTADTTHTTGGFGLIDLYATEHDGANTLSNLTADGNVLSVRGRVGGADRTLFIIDEDGDYHYDGADGGAFDTYEDAHLVRAFANATSKHTLRTAHDDWVQYNEDTLVDIGVLGAPVSEGGLINGAQLQRVHTGAIWQNYMAISDTGSRVDQLEAELADTKSRLAIAESKLKQLPQA